MKTFALAALLLATGLAAPAQAQEDCAHPYVVVVKNDGSVVEGTLVKDIERGVLVDVGGRTQLVPEAEIAEVVEDCSRVAPAARAAPQATAPTPRPRPVDKERRFRTEVIGTGQTAARWVGSGCLGLGCNIMGAGVITAIGTLAYMIVQGGLDPLTSLVFTGIVTAIFGVAAAIFMGGGGALLLGAKLADFAKPDDDLVPIDSDADAEESAARAAPAM